MADKDKCGKDDFSDDLSDEEIDKNCWTKKTRFQTSMILIHLAALPFFVVVLAIYLAFILVWNQSEQCANLCKALDSYEQRLVKAPRSDAEFGSWAFLPKGWEKYYTHPPGRKRRASDIDCQKSEYPFVAALLQNIYEDDKEEYILKCAVPILTNNWILTTKRCIGYPLKSFLVRTNSDYWSKGGTVRKIKQMVLFQELVALQLEPGISDHCLKILEILDTDVVAKQAVTFMWKTDFSVPLEERRKYGRLERVAVNQSENLVFSCLDKCPDSVSPLIDLEHNYLIGFHFHENETLLIKKVFNQVLTSL